VVSGPGLVNLARFLAEEDGRAVPTWLEAPDAPAHAAAHDPAALAWMAELYGAEAGNMALRVLARGGVWLCGGIAPRMLHVLRAGGFARRFHEKGKVSHTLAGIPVRVVTHPSLGLLGAAAEALRMG
jgi:glucokinase